MLSVSYCRSEKPKVVSVLLNYSISKFIYDCVVMAEGVMKHFTYLERNSSDVMNIISEIHE
jgi:hypothetical protein